MKILCPNCRNECFNYYTFCNFCGQKIDFSFKCCNCENPYLLGQNFCIKCGEKLLTKEKEIISTKNWKLFPISLILYGTILIVHIIFNLIFRETAIKNIAIVSIFDTIMIIIWASFSVFNIKSILKLKYNFKWWHLPIFLICIICGFFLALGFVKILQFYLQMPDISMVSKMEKVGYSFFSIILIVCVQPAIIEELSFRGIIYKSLENALSPKETILISAFLFAMLHLSLISLPHLLLLGIFFGYLRYKTNSLIPSMIAHFIHNFLAVIFDKYNLI